MVRVRVLCHRRVSTWTMRRNGKIIRCHARKKRWRQIRNISPKRVKRVGGKLKVLPPPKRTLFHEPRYKKYADIIKIDTPENAQEACTELEEEWSKTWKEYVKNPNERTRQKLEG